MSFLAKLLAPKQTVHAPEQDTVSRAEYFRLEDRFNRVVAKAQELGRLLGEGEKDIRALNEIAMAFQRERDTARAEAEANKADAERYRAKLKRDREYHAGRRVKAGVA